MTEDKKIDPVWRIVPFVVILFSVFMATRSTVSHYPPLPPRPRITSISSSDPDVLRLKQFAEEHQMTWEIVPDTFGGTDYCVTLMRREPFVYKVACRQIIKEAVDAVLEKLATANVRVGSEEPKP
jgi:hypothetical protein